MLKVQW